jgi:hypothetical protein
MALKPCHECGAQVSTQAETCPGCGIRNPTLTVEPTFQHVRVGIQQAKVGETGLKIISIEAFIIALAIGVGTKSWGVGIFVFIGAIALFTAIARSEILANVLAAIMGLAWATAAFAVTTAGQAASGTALGVALLAGLIGGGAHLAGLQNVRDIGESDKRSDKRSRSPAEATPGEANREEAARNNIDEAIASYLKRQQTFSSKPSQSLAQQSPPVFGKRGLASRREK